MTYTHIQSESERLKKNGESRSKPDKKAIRKNLRETEEKKRKDMIPMQMTSKQEEPHRESMHLIVVWVSAPFLANLKRVNIKLT